MVVVGGGIVGAATAYYLTTLSPGLRGLLVERGSISHPQGGCAGAGRGRVRHGGKAGAGMVEKPWLPSTVWWGASWRRGLAAVLLLAVHGAELCLAGPGGASARALHVPTGVLGCVLGCRSFGETRMFRLMHSDPYFVSMQEAALQVRRVLGLWPCMLQR